jgi:hypothetical protein
MRYVEDLPAPAINIVCIIGNEVKKISAKIVVFG